MVLLDLLVNTEREEKIQQRQAEVRAFALYMMALFENPNNIN